MDSFGNYPRERFDPFSVMLFKALQVVAFLFFIALLAMKIREAKSGKIDTKAEFHHHHDLARQPPRTMSTSTPRIPWATIVWYHVREAGFMVLEPRRSRRAEQHHPW